MKIFAKNLIAISLCVACLPPTKVSAGEGTNNKVALYVGFAGAAVLGSGYYAYQHYYKPYRAAAALASGNVSVAGLATLAGAAGANPHVVAALASDGDAAVAAVHAAQAVGAGHAGQVVANLGDHASSLASSLSHDVDPRHENPVEHIVGSITGHATHRDESNHAVPAAVHVQPAGHGGAAEVHQSEQRPQQLFELYNRSPSLRKLAYQKSKEHNLPLDTVGTTDTKKGSGAKKESGAKKKPGVEKKPGAEKK